MPIDYKAIADEVSAKGYADYETAFAAMSAETVSADKTTAIVTEGMILSGLGVTEGSTFIAALEANLPAPVIRVLQASGIDVADPEAKASLAAMLAGGLITQAAADFCAAQAVEVKPKWPRLEPGHVQNAVEGFGSKV